MRNGRKSRTHKTGENTPSVWWYDNAEKVYNFEKRGRAEDGFTKVRVERGKVVRRGVALDRQTGGGDIRQYFKQNDGGDEQQ